MFLCKGFSNLWRGRLAALRLLFVRVYLSACPPSTLLRGRNNHHTILQSLPLCYSCTTARSFVCASHVHSCTDSVLCVLLPRDDCHPLCVPCCSLLLSQSGCCAVVHPRVLMLQQKAGILLVIKGVGVLDVQLRAVRDTRLETF